MNNFYTGSLCPARGVNCSLFNLFAITAVCIYIIPEGESRKINEVGVYVVTAVFSIFAYVWVVAILVFNTPDVIDVGEGISTFIFFPILVVFAYITDKGCLTSSGDKDELSGFQFHSRAIEMSADEKAELALEIPRLEKQGLAADQIKKLVENNITPKTTRAARRVQATRRITGGQRVQIADKHHMRQRLRQRVWNISSHSPTSMRPSMRPSIRSSMRLSRKVHPFEPDEDFDVPSSSSQAENNPFLCDFEFKKDKIAVSERHGILELAVRRTGNLSGTASVKYRTEDGTAQQIMDYIPTAGILEFEPNEEKQTITVEIVDDDSPEDDEEFYVHLFDAHSEAGPAAIGPMSTLTVLVIDDDRPGELVFPEDVTTVTRAAEDQVARLKVERRGGAMGPISCKYEAEDATAIEGRDYVRTKGTLEFADKQIHAWIEITILGSVRHESNEYFNLKLTKAKGGANFHPESNGGSDCCILRIKLEASAADERKLNRVESALQSTRATSAGQANWADQFRRAILVNGGDGDAEASCLDWMK